MEAVLHEGLVCTRALWVEAFHNDEENINDGLELEIIDVFSSSSVISTSVKGVSTLQCLATVSTDKLSVWVALMIYISLS